MEMKYRKSHQSSTRLITTSTQFYEGFLSREGKGGGLFTITGTATGVKGSCRAAVYSSSSDNEGDDDNGESVGESNGFVDR